MEEIKSPDGKTVALVVRNEYNKEGINFISENHYPLQVGINNYRKNEKIKPHSHINRKITINTAQEVIYIKSGKAKLDLYDGNNSKFQTLTLSTGDLVFFISGGHGFQILENTTIIEVKQGPYNGKNQDKMMIN
jgi:hypothetical protein